MKKLLFLISLSMVVVLLPLVRAAERNDGKIPSNSLFIGAWRHDFFDSIAIFLMDGRVLFTQLKVSDEAVDHWHLAGTWKLIQADQAEVTLPQKNADMPDIRKLVYTIDRKDPDELISPHGGTLVRISAKK